MEQSSFGEDQVRAAGKILWYSCVWAAARSKAKRRGTLLLTIWRAASLPKNPHPCQQIRRGVRQLCFSPGVLPHVKLVREYARPPVALSSCAQVHVQRLICAHRAHMSHARRPLKLLSKLLKIDIYCSKIRSSLPMLGETRALRDTL